jgi:hypothetical protein
MEQSEEDDSSDDEDKEPRRKRAYASLLRIVVHEMYPGGPKRTILEGDWFTESRARSPCPIAGTPVVQADPNKTNHFNFQAKFVFLENCYERPVAVWPHDPIHKKSNNRKLYDVIDLNQDQQAS